MNRTTVVCTLLFDREEAASPASTRRTPRELWDLVNRQDWAICESVQRGMSSRAYQQGWFAPMESESLDIRRWLLPRLEAGDAVSAERFDYAVVGLGALGSAACMELALRGHRVVGLERFALGHSRGASHDTSRILRHSYHTPAYVRMTSRRTPTGRGSSGDSGAELVTTVGGLDLFPPGAAISPVDYVASLAQAGIALRGARHRGGRRPVAAVPAPRGNAGAAPGGRRDRARRRGAPRSCSEQAGRTGRELRAESPVTGLRETGSGVELATPDGVVAAAGVVVCADAWTNQVLAPLGVSVPLEVTLEQVTYFRPDDVRRFEPGRHPLWIWMDDPCFYGFPATASRPSRSPRTAAGPRSTPTTGRPSRTRSWSAG